MKEPIPVYIVKPINYGGVWFVLLLAIVALYYAFYSTFADVAETYWFLAPVVFLPGGVIETAWNAEYSHGLWQFLVIALAVICSPMMFGFAVALSLLALPVWAVWWLVGDTVLELWQPVTLAMLMVVLVGGAVFSWKWWRARRRLGSAFWPAALFVLFSLLTIPNLAYWAGMVYWNQYDAEQVAIAKAYLSNEDSGSLDALVDLARESGTGEVYYLASTALANAGRYKDVLALMAHATETTSPRETFFTYPVYKALQRGWDTGYFDEVLTQNDLPLLSEFMPSTRANRIETGFNRIERENEHLLPEFGILCTLPMIGVNGDSPPDMLRPESVYVLAFLPTSEAGLLFCRTVKHRLWSGE